MRYLSYEPPRVSEVRPGSPSATAGIQAGEYLLSVNGRTPADVLEYLEQADAADVVLEMRRGAEKQRVALSKRPGEPLGLVFESAVFKGTMICGNRCGFCFVDQLPPNLRPGLYLKDDDYRLSFLFGNFISLTNLGSSDMRRILDSHLSPLYVSLQAAEPSLRKEIFHNRRAASSLKFLGEMLDAGLEVHLQVVVCPGLNDGPALLRTLELVGDRYSAAASLGLVPVGFTHLGPAHIRRVGRREAEDILALAAEYQERWLATLGRRMVYASDEFYLIAGKDFPAEEEYEGYPQLQNGVGLARKFIAEVEAAGRASRLESRGDVLAVTGMAGAVVLQRALHAAGLEDRQALSCLLPVPNRLFGREVTVTGLVAGRDIIAAYRASGEEARRLVVPACMLREDQFIDGTTLEELRRAVGLEVEVVQIDGRAFISAVAGREVAT